MFYIPIIGSFFEAALAVIEKKVLRKHNINAVNFTMYSFLSIIIVMLIPLYFFWKVTPEATQLTNLLIFISIVVTSVFANITFAYSLKRENLSEMEPIRLMQPLFILLIAFSLSFFFSAYYNERNYPILILSLIASLTLILSHVTKRHLKMDKYILAGIIGNFLFALEVVISKSILPYYSSFTFYFLRSLFIFIICIVIWHPKIKPLKKGTRNLFFIMGIIAVIYRLIIYYGYQNIGIIMTTILFLLSTILIYISAAVFLKEKIKKQQIISSIVIITCIIISIIISK